jgi:hypothetical protein
MPRHRRAKPTDLGRGDEHANPASNDPGSGPDPGSHGQEPPSVMRIDPRRS